MSVLVDVKVDGNDLARFQLRHAYTRLSGILSMILSLAALFMLLINWPSIEVNQRGVLIVIVLLFTIIQPLLLIYKARKQVKNTMLKDSFLYQFDENGMTVSQGELSQSTIWDHIRKVIIKENFVYIYVTAYNAVILPKDKCGGHFDEVVACIKEYKGIK